MGNFIQKFKGRIKNKFIKKMDCELSEIEVILLLNSLNFFLQEMENEDNPKTKRALSIYVDFKNSDNYCDMYNLVRDFRDYTALKANNFFYSISNDNFFKGQKDFLVKRNIKDFYNSLD